MTMKSMQYFKLTAHVIYREQVTLHEKGCLSSVVAFLEMGKSASRSLSSLKFYLRMTVAWPLCLRHKYIKKGARNIPQ